MKALLLLVFPLLRWLYLMSSLQKISPVQKLLQTCIKNAKVNLENYTEIEKNEEKESLYPEFIMSVKTTWVGMDQSIEVCCNR